MRALKRWGIVLSRGRAPCASTCAWISVLLFPLSTSAQAPLELGRTSVTQIEDQSFKAPNFNGRDPLGANSTWFQALKRDVSALPADPLSQVMLSRMVSLGGHLDPIVSGPWTPVDWSWYTWPFQVVSGATPYTSIAGTWSYNPASNGPYMLPPEPVVHEAFTNLTYPTSNANYDTDHHLAVYVRDEASGGFKELWEYYQAYVDKDAQGAITGIHGSSWRKFDLKNGENPGTDVQSTDAAGLPITPLVIRYEEVATGSINHAIRFQVNNSDISPTYKWPARTAASVWNRTTGMPYGTIVSFNEQWYQANADTVLGVGTHARIIGDAIRKYGMILSDGTSGSNIQIMMVADLRWQSDLANRLSSVPVSAFEVKDTPPMLKIDGPRQLAVNQTGTWTIQTQPSEAILGAGTSIDIWDANGGLVAYHWAMPSDAQKTIVTTFSFTQPGVYTFKPYQNWFIGREPYTVVVGATTPTPTPSPISPTPTSVATSTKTPLPTPTRTSTPTATRTAAASVTSNPVPTRTGTPTPTPMPTLTVIPSSTPTAVATSKAKIPGKPEKLRTQ